MSVVEYIRQKRLGSAHTPAQMQEFLSAYLQGHAQDSHMAAWLMAVCLQGMTLDETRTWTRLMRDSGKIFPRLDRSEFWVDKHSTGGVGDKTSLLLVPWVYSTARRLWGDWLKIPMVSGRGLDFTAGTLDKLESVPGFRCDIDLEQAARLLGSQGFVMMGQTEELAPADKRIYALRDVTATVDCVPLIVSSIVSKKCAENLDALVLDVKCGAGAFMVDETLARALAERLVEVASGEGLKVTAVLSDMNQPLGTKVGHQLEVEECADFLRGEQQERALKQLTHTLAAWMLASSGKIDFDGAWAECGAELDSKRPYALFEQMFLSQGGDWAAFERRRVTLESRPRRALKAPCTGYVSRLDARALGRAVNALGAGRQTAGALIDLDVGAEVFAWVGDRVEAGQTIVELVGSESCQPEVPEDWPSWIEIAPQPVHPLNVVKEVFNG